MKHSLCAWFAATLTLLIPTVSAAHEMTIAELELREMSRGEFVWQWSARNDKKPDAVAPTVAWPEHCKAEQNVLHCGEKGLEGTLSASGVGQGFSAALVRIHWVDGQSSVHTLTAAQPEARLFGSAQDRRGMGEIAYAYMALGVEHILGGIDHLLFVFSLLFLVGFQRKLVWTITAFTVAHSLTLASASLGWITLRSPPVEAVIALSIVLVAAEALNKRMTLARRWPALLAFLFGLVHGLGFAGALKEVGLPENYLPTALLTFNIGVEVGQLMTVAAAWAIWRLLQRWPVFERGRVPLLYGIGSVAAFWSWLRVAAIVG